MIEIQQNLLPFGQFDHMALYGLLFVKKGNPVTEKVRTHETIHCRQQVELLAAALLLGFVMIPLFGLSLWWLLLAIPFPFACYGFSWLVEWLLPPYDRAYRSMCFEREAYDNEHLPEYASHWWKHLFGWIRYII